MHISLPINLNFLNNSKCIYSQQIQLSVILEILLIGLCLHYGWMLVKPSIVSYRNKSRVCTLVDVFYCFVLVFFVCVNMHIFGGNATLWHATLCTLSANWKSWHGVMYTCRCTWYRRGNMTKGGYIFLHIEIFYDKAATQCIYYIAAGALYYYTMYLIWLLVVQSLSQGSQCLCAYILAWLRCQSLNIMYLLSCQHSQDAGRCPGGLTHSFPGRDNM